MAQDNTILNNFHTAGSDQHPENSMGNQGVFNQNQQNSENKQVGSIEYIPNAESQSVDLKIFNTGGIKVFNL